MISAASGVPLAAIRQMPRGHRALVPLVDVERQLRREQRDRENPTAHAKFQRLMNVPP
jgi:hypothetical protein